MHRPTDSNTQIQMLVVEDERTLQNALRKFFNAAGFHVDCASEVEEAEALVVTRRYDIVIADLRLTCSYDGEGLEILRFVRRYARGTPVVILTGSSSKRIQRSARELGADAFVRKPTPLPELAETVTRVLEGARP